MADFTFGISDLSLLCRVCLLKHSHSCNVFDEICLYQYTYYEVVKECTTVQISKDDRLSSFICCTCASLLKSLITVRKKVVESEILLRNVLDDLCLTKVDSRSGSKEKCIDQREHLILDTEKSDENFQMNQENIQEYVDMLTITVQNSNKYQIDRDNEINIMNEKHIINLDERLCDKNLQLYKSLQESIDIKNDFEDIDIQESIEINKVSSESKIEVCNTNNTLLSSGKNILFNSYEKLRDENSELYNIFQKSINTDNNFENSNVGNSTELDEELNSSKNNNFVQSKFLFNKDQNEFFDNNGNCLGERYKYKICGKKCDNKNSFNYHVQKHIENPPYKCNECNKSYILKVHFLKHKQSHKNNCTICGVQCQTKLNLKRHMRVHKMKDKSLTDMSKELFLYKSDPINPHFFRCYVKLVDIRFQKNITPQVTICTKENYNNTEIKSSVRSEMEPSEDEIVVLENSVEKNKNSKNICGKIVFKCKLCKNQYKTRINLYIHMVVYHTKIRHYQCDICEKYFSSRKSLVEHNKLIKCQKQTDLPRSITKKQSFKCTICPKSFNSKPVFNRHLRRHKNVKTCEVCGKTLMKKNYIRHQQVHLRLQCGICKKIFTNSFKLLTHSFCHVKKQKPMHCDLCDAVYFNQFDLHLHRRLHKW